jgi:hypothetical protein
MYKKNLIGVTETFLASMEKIQAAVLDLNELLGDVTPATTTEQAIIEAFKKEVESYMALQHDSTTGEALWASRPDHSASRIGLAE